VCFVPLGAFGTVWVHYETRWKTGRTSAFVPRSRVGIFCNERTLSNPLDPKLTFWCVSYHLGAFGTIWLPYETRCKTRRTSNNVRATKSRQNFLQRTHPIHLIGPKSDVLVRFVPLGVFMTIWLPYETRWKMGRSSAKVRATNLRQNFSQRTHLIHPIWP